MRYGALGTVARDFLRMTTLALGTPNVGPRSALTGPSAGCLGMRGGFMGDSLAQSPGYSGGRL